ncbi:uncharacterized protein LOC119573443 [Penaeus monodon]|uniref:uncharacterized protein LOC119573443 n=1 Tax=Penaeus monodon TaxID=6687 RepID=UPI0018A6EBA2|nr:uncharacterized protein LOC119573443 [Penaeus monodon]
MFMVVGILDIPKWNCDVGLDIPTWNCDVIMAIQTWSCDVSMVIPTWNCDVSMAIQTWNCDVSMVIPSWNCDVSMVIQTWNCDVSMAIPTWNCVGSNRENGHQGGSMRRSFSKSASDLLNRSRAGSGERSDANSPGGSPPLEARKAGEGERPRVSLANKPSATAFFNTLRTKFHRTRSKDGKLSRRKDILLDGVRSNSHPDVSVERQDSTTDYAADNSSAEHSSSCTPVSMSPRRGPMLSQNRQNSQGKGVEGS